MMRRLCVSCWTGIKTVFNQIEWLPPYSPELNPQEDIWQQMRRRVTHNHYFEELVPLLEAVEVLHHELAVNQNRVLRLISKWTSFIST